MPVNGLIDGRYYWLGEAWGLWQESSNAFCLGICFINFEEGVDYGVGINTQTYRDVTGIPDADHKMD